MHVYISLDSPSQAATPPLSLFSKTAATQQRDGVGGISRGRALFYSDRVADAPHPPSLMPSRLPLSTI